MVRIFSKLTSTTRDLLKAFNKEAANKINQIFSSRRGRIEGRVKNIVREAILKSPEMQSLRSGDLGFDLGIPANEDPVPQVAAAIAESIEVAKPNFKASGEKITGKFVINFNSTILFSLLNEDFAKVVTEKGQTLYWLSWLVEEGDSIIVYGWDVEYGPFGRSGGAHMVEGIGSFKINPAYSGTPTDNFITRAIDSVSDKILAELRG